MRLRWNILDLDAFFDDPRHTVAVTGTVTCERSEASSPCRRRVELFADDAGSDGDELPTELSGGQRRTAGTARQQRGRARSAEGPVARHDRAARRGSAGSPGAASRVPAPLHLTVAARAASVVGMRASGLPGGAVRTIIDFDRFFVANLASVYLAAVRPGRPETSRRLRRNGSRIASVV